MKIRKDYYQILGVPRGATFEDIRKAFKTCAVKFHPDKHDGDAFFEERFKEIREAYEVLSDTERRLQYDLRKFGRSKVIGKTDRSEFVSEGFERSPLKRFKLSVAHADVYLALFYLINLIAWTAVRLKHDPAGMQASITRFFLCGLSGLLMWRFIAGVTAKRKTRPHWAVLVALLVLALAMALIPALTNWIA